MMKRFLSGVLCLALLGAPLSLVPTAPAQAAWVIACAPDVAGGIQGPKQVVVPGSTVASAYSLNSAGCANVGTSDRGWLASQGFTFEGGILSAQVTFSATPATVTLPPGALITNIIAQETSGTSITGGFKVGTVSGPSSTSGTGNVATAQTLASKTIASVSNANILLPTFSSTASTVLFMDATGNSNLLNSQVTVTILYGLF